MWEQAACKCLSYLQALRYSVGLSGNRRPVSPTWKEEMKLGFEALGIAEREFELNNSYYFILYLCTVC